MDIDTMTDNMARGNENAQGNQARVIPQAL
jgi:hypothetical protein